MEPVFLLIFSHSEQPHIVAADAGTLGGTFSYEAWPERPGFFSMRINAVMLYGWEKKQENKSTWYRFHEIHSDSLRAKPAAQCHLSTWCAEQFIVLESVSI